ncbi:Uncharacterised protein [Candidatus Venteria ishoeyi]|uniref:Uncharacterized protein n=1 Tax=Candidatus Venteria ishoeyi TaxID=1899563 RepID=A0A1H6FAT5_9GAMM|nr:Uncharacterised protein [Candidatus Venteria ishoeyi]
MTAMFQQLKNIITMKHKKTINQQLNAQVHLKGDFRP